MLRFLTRPILATGVLGICTFCASMGGQLAEAQLTQPQLTQPQLTQPQLTQPQSDPGQSAWYEGFEGSEPTWKAADADVPYRMRSHQRVQGEAHVGQGCERLVISAGQGTYIHVGHDVGSPMVIDDLTPTIWVRSDRPDLQMAARIVLPRTVDRRTGRPVSTVVRGTQYRAVGQWEQLRIDDVPRQLTRQIRVLRTQLGPGVDGREAYLDRIVLNVYGGPGTTTVWLDDLDIAGHVPSPRASAGVAAGSHVGDPTAADSKMRIPVEMRGSVLLTDGLAMFPRIVRHRGEPLALLKNLGFNTVWLSGPASAHLLAEATAANLWLICPPPVPELAGASSTAPDPNVQIGAAYDCVLAWDLGQGLSRDQLERLSVRVEQVRHADRRGHRPLICQADSELMAYSRLVDVLLIDRRPLGTSLELADYGHWLRGRSRLARPGTPVWATVQTQPAAAVRQQLAAIEPNRPLPLSVAQEQIRLLAFSAVCSGSRALLFESDTRLDAPDADTRRRAMSLQLVNLELQLVEPWVAAGSVVTQIGSSQREVVGSLLRSSRARLLVPAWLAPGAQYAPGVSAANGISLVVPGVPESSSVYVYEMAPGGLRPLKHQPDAGGVRLLFEQFDLGSLVMFAQDPLFVDNLTRRAEAAGPRAAELYRQLAAARLAATASGPSPRGLLDAAQRDLRACDASLAGRDHPSAVVGARRVMRSLRTAQRDAWKVALSGLSSPVSSPAAIGFDTLPWHRRLMQRIAASQTGENRLPGGDFESPGTMHAAGWQHQIHPLSDVQSSAHLLAGAARSGQGGLRLSVEPVDPKYPPALVETAPVWITTPAVPVEAGELVCIHGWVQIPAAVTASVDGLMIIDSLTGEALAERIGQTAGWQQFVLYRIAPRAGQMAVTFALTGLGEVWLDDVAIQPLVAPATSPVTQRPYTAPTIWR